MNFSLSPSQNKEGEKPPSPRSGGSVGELTPAVTPNQGGSTPASPSSSLESAKKPRPSGRMTCDCRAHRDEDKLPGDDEIDQPADSFVPLKTLIFPIVYDRHKPPDLVDDLDGKLYIRKSNLKSFLEPKETNICPEALKKPTPPQNESVFTAFRPILNSLIYANKHAYVINELADNYAYLD